MSAGGTNQSQEKVARSLIRKGDYPAAIDLLQKMLEAAPTDPEIMELLGTVYFFNKQPDQAREIFEQLTVAEPYRASGWINLGAILNHIGEHKKAADALRKGLQRDRQNAEAYYNLAIAQKALKLTTMAISAYKEAIRIKPDMIDAHLNLGLLYAEMNNAGLAQQCYMAVLKINPNSKKAKALLEQAQGTQKNARKSASPFGRLVDEDDLSRNLRSKDRRILNEVQRDEEREMVQALTKRIRQQAKGLAPLLEDDVHDVLHQLQIALIQSENRFANPDTHRRFVKTIRQLKELRTVVADGFAELKSHLSSAS